MSDSLQPYGLQQARLPCPSLSPRLFVRFLSIESVMLSNHLIFWYFLLLSSSIFPNIRLFPNELSLHQVAKVLELQLQHQSFQYLGLISLRIDCFDLLSAQGTLNSLLSSVQSLSHVRLFAAPWTAAHQASLSITNSQSLLKLMSIVSVMPSNHLILLPPLSFPASGSFPMSQFFTSDGQSIGRTDAEAETPILWPPDMKS